MAWSERGTRLFACAVVLVALSAVAVVLRFIARGRILRVLGLSDWFMLLTWLVSLANTVFVGFQVAYGSGQHMADLSPDDHMAYIKLTLAAIFVSNISLVLTKVSVLFLFLDIFVITWIRKATYVVFVLVVLVGLWMTVSNILFCIPPQTSWNPTSPDSRCFNNKGKRFVDAGLNIALELVIFCLPLPVIQSLALRPGQKLWLYFIFALGFFVCLVSFIRLYFLHLALVSTDPSWTGVSIACWSTFEINITIVIACIPTLRPLVVKLWPKLLSSGRSGNLSSSDEDQYPSTISSPPRRLPCCEMDGL